MTQSTRYLLLYLLAVAETVLADSGRGVDTALGNQLEPAVSIPGAQPHPYGLSPFNRHTRSPSGLRYPDVWQLPELSQIGAGDWQGGWATELGMLGTSGETDTASFREYGDWDEAPTLHRLWMRLEKTETGVYVEGLAGAVGRDDQYYRLTAGKYGRFELSGFYHSTPHVFAPNARVLWDGLGSGKLTLPASLTPATSTAAEVQTVFDTIGQNTLALRRDKAGVSLKFQPTRRLELFAQTTSEQRDGTRPFGGAFSYPSLGQVMETIEPIDYRTHDFSAGLRWGGVRQQINVAYAGSVFRNNQESLTWENPGLSTFSPFTPNEGRFALAPDNDYHNLRIDYGSYLPVWRGRITASASYSSMRQDEALLPPTISSGLLNAGGRLIDLDLWNTVDALSARHADAEINHLPGSTKLTVQPTRKLKLTASLRFRDEDNKTDYSAFNPLTGDYGYIALDGGLGAVFATRSAVFDPSLPGSRVRIRNVPFEKDEFSAELGASYRVSSKTKLGLSYRHVEIDHAFRERSTVEDDAFRIQLTQRGFPRGSLRVAYEFVRRTGDEYNSNPYEPFYSSSLPGFTPRFPDGNAPHTLSALRKLDLASRDRHLVDVKLQWVLSDASDLSVGGRWEQDNLVADYGLRDTETASLNAEWSLHLATNSTVYLYYSNQIHERNVANINDSFPVGSDPDPGGVVFPLANAWSERIQESNTSIGGGYSHSFERLSLELDYSYGDAESRFDYSFNSPAAFGNLFSEFEAGTRFPDQSFRHHLFQASLRRRIKDRLRLRFLYRFEKEQLGDYHYQGLSDPLVRSDIFLVAVPEDFSVSVFGVMVEASL